MSDSTTNTPAAATGADPTAGIDFGGLVVQTVVAPRPSIVREGDGFFKILYKSLRSLFSGMNLTFRYFRRPSTIVTQEYPENRDTLKMYDRYRGKLELIHDEDGQHGCTACKICERECPNASIIITKHKSGVTGKPVLDDFIWRQDTCTFCNICVMVCPFSTLEMTGDFESSVYDRRLLIYNINEYAGPTKTILKKLEDPEDIKARMVPKERYDGAIPMCGVEMDGIPALEGLSKSKENEGVTDDE